MVSGILHGAVVALGGSPMAAVVFGLIFVGLGLVGCVVIHRKNRNRRRWRSA
jgi:hypothetical protein